MTKVKYVGKDLKNRLGFHIDGMDGIFPGFKAKEEGNYTIYAKGQKLTAHFGYCLWSDPNGILIEA